VTIFCHKDDPDNAECLNDAGQAGNEFIPIVNMSCAQTLMFTNPMHTVTATIAGYPKIEEHDDRHYSAPREIAEKRAPIGRLTGQSASPALNPGNTHWRLS
jgi:hypothetical protein